MPSGRPKGYPKTGGGSRLGKPNKVNRELRELARDYTEEAVTTLATIMRDSESDQAKAMAADKLLDRGHGKATQIIAGDKENPILHVIQGLKIELGTKLDRIAQRDSA